MDGKSKTEISTLPENILLEIFRYLAAKELCIVCRVCRSWRRIANDNAMWRHVDLTPYRLNLNKMWKVIRAHFSDVLLSLQLQGYHQAGSVHLMKNSLSEAMMRDLCERCPNINRLVLINNHFTKVQLDQMPEKLRVLKLNRSFIPPGWFSGISVGNLLPELRVLDLSECSKTSDTDIQHVCTGWTALTELYLSKCYRLTAKALQHIGDNLTALRVLDASEVSVCDLGLHHVCRNIKGLEELNLQGGDVSHAAVINSVVTLHKLTSLNLRSNPSITDATLLALNALTTLQRLDVSYTTVTVAAVERFIGSHCNGDNMTIVHETHASESQQTVEYQQEG